MATRIEIMPNDPTYLFWAGDGAKTDGNAVFYIKNNGTSYFAGSLTAGQLVTSAVNEARTPAATVESGLFGTNGGNKVVTFALSYMNIGMLDGSIGNGSNSATLNLFRSYNGGSWTAIDSTSASGSYSSEWDGELGQWTVISNISGAKNFTDTLGGTGTFNYRVTITGASGQWPITVGPPWDQGRQSLSVRSVEG